MCVRQLREKHFLLTNFICCSLICLRLIQNQLGYLQSRISNTEHSTAVALFVRTHSPLTNEDVNDSNLSLYYKYHLRLQSSVRLTTKSNRKSLLNGCERIFRLPVVKFMQALKKVEKFHSVMIIYSLEVYCYMMD